MIGIAFVAGVLAGSIGTSAFLALLAIVSRSTFWRIIAAVNRLIEADAEPDRPPPRASRTL